MQPAKNMNRSIYQVENLQPFQSCLTQQGLFLTRGECTTLQVNVGLLCNQSCRHCHLDAGPARNEVMTEKTVMDVIDLAARFKFAIIDITGGAPEMNPHIETLVRRLAPLTQTLILRSNLTVIAAKNKESLLELLIENRVTIVASLPSLNEVQTEAQRGINSFAASINTLKKLNRFGYGLPDTDLKLNLVSNPTGAFLPAAQDQVEKRFRRMLAEKWGVSFNELYTFANVPLGRFLFWLQDSGNLENYIQTGIEFQSMYAGRLNVPFAYLRIMGRLPF